MESQEAEAKAGFQALKSRLHEAETEAGFGFVPMSGTYVLLMQSETGVILDNCQLFLSPPVPLHGGLICIAFCLYVPRPKLLEKNSYLKNH